MDRATLDQTTQPAPGAVEMMTAVVQDEYGTAPEEVLRIAQVDRPTPADDEVLVHVRAASVDRGTWHLMAGMPLLMRAMGFGLRTPKVANPGRSLAGTVEAVGKDVTEFKPGDEVYGTSDAALADYARTRPSLLALKPANLSFEQAAAVPVSGVTALQAVRKAQVQPGEKVLVLGASGGVGTFAVQMAKAIGAEVTGVSSRAKVDLVRSLGADHVVDYTHGDVTDGEQRYDVIIDTGGNRPLSHLRRALTSGGRLIIVGGETGGRWLGGWDRSLRAPMLSPLVSQTLGGLTSKENAGDLAALRELIESGKLTPAIDRTYPLGEAAAAIRYFQDGHAQGKVVITV